MSRARTFVFLAIVLVVEVFYALYNPPYNYPDERSHLQCAMFYRYERRLPDPYDEGEKIQQDKHPPYAYVAAALLLHGTAGWFDESETRIELWGPYERTVVPGRMEAVRLTEPGRVAEGQLILLRLMMLAHWLVAAWSLLRIADLVWRGWPCYAFSLALSIALIPQAALGGAAFTPDTPLVAFSTGAFYFLLRAAAGLDSARAVGLRSGAFLALALLTKSAAVFLLPVLGIAAIARARARGESGEAWRVLGWAALPAVVSSAWYVRNLVLYGDPFQMQAQIEAYAHSIRREPLTSTFFEAFFWDLFRTFFGFYDRQVLLPRPVYFALAGVCGVAVTGLCLLLRRTTREEAEPVELGAIPLALAGSGVLLALVTLGNLTVPSAQGRYLYPALGGILVLAGIGLKVGARLRRDSRWHVVAASAWVVFGLWAFHWSVLRHETAGRARAAGEGGVLFYEDCGTPNLQPHLVQGHTAPGLGQLGRIVSWRTFNGHEDAVVYRFPLEAPRPLQVRVVYFAPPDPVTPYRATFETGRFVYGSQRLWANDALLHDAIEVTGAPQELVFPLPQRRLREGRLELRFERISGAAAVVSEIWVEEPWLVLEGTRLANRTARMLPYLVLFARAGQEGHHDGVLAPGVERDLAAYLPERPDRVQVLLRERSPWVRREAEAHPAKGARWLGDLRASGGYRMHGRGRLAELPLGRPAGPFLLLARARTPGQGWQLVEIPGSALSADGLLSYESTGASPTSLDYVLLTGGWRP